MHSTSTPAPVLRLGGIAGILAGLLVLSFAITSSSKGLLFFQDVYSGGSVVPWIQNVMASPSLSRFIMVIPVAGFTCFLITGVVLYQYIGERNWQKNLGLVGYSIGVPFTMALWVMQLSLMNHVLLLYGKSPETDAQIARHASFILYLFQISNDIFGPLFIIVLGSGMMAWAALKVGALPKWLCYWGMACGVLLALSFLFTVNPAFGLLGLAAPLHMVWFILVGGFLLLQARNTA